MVHGGPFPATPDVCSTSVGTLAMARFLRPVFYQNLPDELLPLITRNKPLELAALKLLTNPTVCMTYRKS